jgi:hypothetical protein
MRSCMRPFALLLLVACGGCRAIDNGPSEEPAPAPVMVPDAVTETERTAPSSSSSTPPPLAYNCQAQLAAIEEVTRLLTVAATHATTSSACVDGPGRRVAIDEILVCPTTGKTTTMGFAATYRVTEFSEGGQGHCRPECPAPRVERGRIDVVFEKQGDAFALKVPASIQGLPADATPVGKAHDGDCYGKSRPFTPQPVAL